MSFELFVAQKCYFITIIIFQLNKVDHSYIYNHKDWVIIIIWIIIPNLCSKVSQCGAALVSSFNLEE